MDHEFDVVSGDFEGTFYTNQKSVLTPPEWNSGIKDHAIHLYRGELSNVLRETIYEPEKQVNRESLLLHNVTNVQFHIQSDSGENQSRIFDFEQLLIRNADIKHSWELNGKTYGIVRGSILGKVRKAGSHFDPTNPPPPGSPEIPRIGPDDGNRYPPRRNSSECFRTVGGCFTGLLSNFWRLLLALILLLIFWWLFRSCSGFGPTEIDCCSERDSLEIEINRIRTSKDSIDKELKEIKDSTKLTKVEDELERIAAKLYFKGDKAEILKYSERQLDQLVDLLEKDRSIELVIRGYYNGSDSVYNLDVKRAARVMELLVEKGINKARMSAVGMGRSELADSQDLEVVILDGEEIRWNRNMRVEIVIVK